MKKILFLLVIFSAFLMGCDAVTPFVSPIVSGVVIWSEGKAIKYYESSPKVTYLAVRRVCTELGYKIIKDEVKKDIYYIVAGNNDRFKIYITPVEQNIVSVGIRVNFLGDKPYAEMFYSKLDTELEIIYFDQGKPAYTKLPTNLD